jgi:hypothetical protein
MLGCALWVGAWLRGRASSDDTIDALAGLVPDAPGGVMLVSVRSTAAESAWLLLPRPGRPLGWPRDAEGPPEPAVLLCRADDPVALLRTGPAGWRLDRVGLCNVAPLAAAALAPRAAARAFAAAVSEGAEQLERMDLARAQDRALPSRWRSAAHAHPPGLDPSAVEVLVRVATLLDALDLALATDGAAVTAAEARGRAGALASVRDALEDIVCGLVGGQLGVAGSVSP